MTTLSNTGIDWHASVSILLSARDFVMKDRIFILKEIANAFPKPKSTVSIQSGPHRRKLLILCKMEGKMRMIDRRMAIGGFVLQIEAILKVVAQMAVSGTNCPATASLLSNV